ncbi:MAG TPA: hypothetical protein DCE41_05385 [Cytophagales bacterium]|nr:hypothetical protein [Cytophagales bacterium]
MPQTYTRLFFMDHTFISQDSFTVVGYSTRIDPAAPHTVDAHWERFRAENPIEQIEHRINDDIWAVYFNYEGDHTQPYDLLIGYRVEQSLPATKNLSIVTVPANYYAMFFAQGKLPDAIQETWLTIHTSGLDRIFQVDFEVYGRFAQDPSDAEVPVYISVKE